MTAPQVPSRSRTPLLIALVAALACAGLVLVLVLAGVAGGVIFWRGDPSADDPTSAEGSEGSEGDDPAAGQDGAGLVAPPGATEDQPYLELSTSDDGPVVDVYLDFLCPHCATFHDNQAEELTRLAQEEEITLRMHPRPMLDASSTPSGYSGRAANAAVCAYAEDPTQWAAAEAALFAHQPGAEGLDDDELGTVIEEATGLDVSGCIAEQTYLGWIEDVVEPEALATGQGTPAVFIDGEQFTGDPAAPGSLAEQLETA